jgi:4-amino-4-deoxy-L-arabinose transferase-like glycosyltransferase
LARTDAVFAFTVTATAFAAFKAWEREGGWVWFWLLAAAATLAKGPLGLVLGAGGLLAGVWEKKSGHPAPVRGNHLPGIGLFLVIVGGWFALAYLQDGQALIDKMLGKELAGHVLKSKRASFPGMLFYQPPLYYLSRAAPWSLLAFYGFWRLCRQPATDAWQRRFERFLFCWFALGMLIFCLAPHQRADLLWPLMPAGALLAGRELDRLGSRMEPRRFQRAMTVAVLVGLVAFAVNYFGLNARQPIVRKTIALRELAREIETRAGRGFPLTFVDTRMTLQVYLNVMRPNVSYERAAELLRGPEPVFVAVTNEARLRTLRQTNDGEWHTLLTTSEPAELKVRIVGNRADFGKAGSR